MAVAAMPLPQVVRDPASPSCQELRSVNETRRFQFSVHVATIQHACRPNRKRHRKRHIQERTLAHFAASKSALQNASGTDAGLSNSLNSQLEPFNDVTRVASAPLPRKRAAADCGVVCDCRGACALRLLREKMAGFSQSGAPTLFAGMMTLNRAGKQRSVAGSGTDCDPISVVSPRQLSDSCSEHAATFLRTR